MLLLSGCQAPLLDLQTTRSLQAGASATLTNARSLEITGAYTEAGRRWSIDVQFTRPATQHLTMSSEGSSLEALVVGGEAYFRGRTFLTTHLVPDPRYQELARLSGDGWWRGPLPAAATWPHLTDGAAFTETFLGAALTGRRDHVQFAGRPAVELSGPRADVYVDASPPHAPLGLRMRRGVLVDGLADADLRFGNFNVNFGLAPPARMIDFSDFAPLPPSYAVIAVDTSQCRTPCVVAAQARNQGGRQPARAPSTVSFRVTEPVSGRLLGGCQAPVLSDVGPGAITRVSCTVPGFAGGSTSAAAVTALADNPGRT